LINFFIWGLKLITENRINNFITKIFFTLIYLIFGTTVLNIFYNDSFWLIDNGNGGFVGRTIKENIYYFTPLIENWYVVYSLILFTIVFFLSPIFTSKVVFLSQYSFLIIAMPTTFLK